MTRSGRAQTTSSPEEPSPPRAGWPRLPGIAAGCLLDGPRSTISGVAAGLSGSSRTFAGSWAMSAEGRISRTWWNAHLLNGEVRQFASVTCVSGRGGNPSIKRPVIAFISSAGYCGCRTVPPMAPCCKCRPACTEERVACGRIREFLTRCRATAHALHPSTANP
jgi:hypothetical protein